MKKNLVVLITCFVLLFAGVTITRAAFPMHQATTAAAASANSQNASFSQAPEEAAASAPAAAHAPKPGGGNKNQWVALLLCFFLGGIGIHRFYLGYTWQGVVQLLTGGGCGIWALIDLIRIITGDLQPKDGRYGTEI